MHEGWNYNIGTDHFREAGTKTVPERLGKG